VTTALLDHGTALTADNLNAIVELTEDGMNAREIADQLGIGKHSVERGRRVMGVKGYNPSRYGQPVDDVAVLRAVRGDRMNLNLDERREAVLRLHKQGVQQLEIARILGLHVRTVGRHIANARRDDAA